MLKAAFPGSFDPPTFGHLDIIGRAAALFDELVVVLAENPQKKGLFPLDERLSMVSQLVTPWKNVSVDRSDGLMVEYMQARGIRILVRGIRGLQDFSYEFDLSLWNKTLDPGIETIFMPTDPRYVLLSSSAIKELASYRRDLSALVPPLVAEALGKKYFREGPCQN
jgi:pantetheine-phosphate adenylyltransferase